MISDEKIIENLIEIYSKYLDNPKDKLNIKNAFEVYTRYFNGADTIFGEEVSKAIWSSFDLFEGKLSEKETKRILEYLKKSEK